MLGMVENQAGITAVTHGFNLVVLGSMNPRLHYPQWYQLIGCLSEEEANAARESPLFVVSPAFARFNTDKFTIQCTPDRWDISAGDEDDVARAVEIAARVFEKLSETPVGAFGFNTFQDDKTTAENTAILLSGLIL